MVTYADIVDRKNLKDLPLRFAYAFSIMKEDGERAAFIAAQVTSSLYRRLGISYGEQYDFAEELLTKKAEKTIFEEDIEDLLDHSFYEPNFKRWTPSELLPFEPRYINGFIEEITISAAAFLQRAEELYQLAPIRHLNLEKVHPLTKDFFSSPQLEGIVSLNLWQLRGGGVEQKMTDEDIYALANSPYLKDLAWLNISGNSITNKGLEALAQSTSLPKLQILWFGGNSTSEDYTEEIWNDQGVDIGSNLTSLGEHLKHVSQGKALWVNPYERGLDHMPLIDDF